MTPAASFAFIVLSETIADIGCRGMEDATHIGLARREGLSTM
jgi:hypothetical protein